MAENEAAKATWFKQTNGYYVMGLSILTATLVGVLPLGSWLFINGRVEAGTLITCIILALGLVKPLIQALQYTDSLAMVDSTVKEVGNLLDEPELVRPTERAVLADADVSLIRLPSDTKRRRFCMEFPLTAQKRYDGHCGSLRLR